MARKNSDYKQKILYAGKKNEKFKFLQILKNIEEKKPE